MKKIIIVRATMDLGDYLYACLAPDIEALGYEPMRMPINSWKLYPEKNMEDVTELGSQFREMDQLHNFINENRGNVAFILHFSDWAHRWLPTLPDYRHIKPKVPVVFWSREDPFHYKIFKWESETADIICTSEEESIPDYKKDYPDTPTICTPMAAAPHIFHPAVDKDREWDIVFVGNRYKNREVRERGESEVLIPAIEWALENNKKIGVWGKGGPGTPDLFTWENLPLVWDTPGVYQPETLRLEAADIYRKAKVVLSYTSCPDAQTMLPNRLLQAAATGCVILSQRTPATDRILGKSGYHSSRSAEETKKKLSHIFDNLDECFQQAESTRTHVISNHTFKQRLERIIRVVERLQK